MAATYILRGGTSHPHRVCAILPPKQHSKPSQLPYSTIIHPKSTKVRAFSVRACDQLSLSDVRKRSIDAIDFSGRRVTIGDVVSKGSFKSSQAQKALQALEKLKTAAAFLMRVSFWASLAASSVVKLTVATPGNLFWRVFNSSEANRQDDLFCEVFKDLCSGKLIEYVFSFVFGDGDPNHGIEEKKWKMIGEYIALNGGVVTAEELAPYLDPAIIEKNDELYILPVLHRFDGQAKVDEEGNILYHFPLVYCTPPPRRMSGEMEHVGRFVDWDIKVDKFLEETKWKFSKLNPKEISYVNLVLKHNRFCVAVLGIFAKWTEPGSCLLSISYFSYLFLPLLLMYVIYATIFLSFASLRPSSIEIKNAEIEKRNEARRQHAKALESPNPSLKLKLLSARAMAQRISEGNKRIVYSSGIDLSEQQNYERQEWDRSLSMFELNKV